MSNWEEPRFYETTRDWVAAIAELPATPTPIALRTVVVPRRRVAHALRREIVRQAKPEILIGTRFVTPLVAASEVLRRAGETCSPNEAALRPLRLRAAIAGAPTLEDLDAVVLREQLGWPEAIAAALEDLESCGFAAETLPKTSARLRDVAALWTMAMPPGDPSETLPRILARATGLLEADPSLWPWQGPCLAGIAPDSMYVEASFLRAIPGLQLVVRRTRVNTTRTRERAAAVFGTTGSDNFANSAPSAAPSGELARLRERLFASLRVQGSRSGQDGSVDLELHAGVDAELDAAVDWVAHEVLELATPLEDIALLTPNLMPVVPLLVARLERLPWPGGPVPIIVPEGLPATSQPGGPRILGVLRALESGVDAPALARILPWLRTSGADGPRLSMSEAVELAYSLGTPGGHAVLDGAARPWPDAARTIIGRLEAHLEREPGLDPEDPPDKGAQQSRRKLESLRALLDPLEELHELLSTVEAGASLGKVWSGFEDLLEECVSLPPDGKQILKMLKGSVEAIEADPVSNTLNGWVALETIRHSLERLRVPRGSFGEPGIYVGTISEARGIPFHSVRALGLCEGSFPRNCKPDAVLPDTLRAALHSACPRMEDASLSDRTAIEELIANTHGRIVFSAPKQDLDGTGKEPSSLFVELAVAIDRSGTKLDAQTLERDYFRPARIASTARRDRCPIGERAILRAVARRKTQAPARWARTAATDPARILALLGNGGRLDGHLCGAAPHGRVRGVTPERPVSPSRLKTLLECPHRFLLEHVLALSAPAEARSAHEVSPMVHGSAFHKGAEALVTGYGARLPELAAIPNRRAELLEVAMTAAEGVLADWPFADDVARGHALGRLEEEFARLLEHDASRGPLSHLEVERHFGSLEEPVELVAGERRLHVTGFIDRMETRGASLTIVDFKTGGARPRVGSETDPVPTIDLQLAVYEGAATELGPTWGLPPPSAVEYRYVSRLGVESRRFAEDELLELRGQAADWLTLSATLLSNQTFPRSPATGPCRDCHFRAVCGEAKNLESRARLIAAARDDEPGLAELARLYSLGSEEEEADDE